MLLIMTFNYWVVIMIIVARTGFNTLFSIIEDGISKKQPKANWNDECCMEEEYEQKLNPTIKSET